MGAKTVNFELSLETAQKHTFYVKFDTSGPKLTERYLHAGVNLLSDEFIWWNNDI